MYRHRSSDSESESDSSDGETSWKRAPRNTTDGQKRFVDSTDEHSQPASGARRKNRVWGDVVQEEALTGDMTMGFGVQALPRDCREDRGVESYDYTRARFDPRPPVEPVPTEAPKELMRIREQRAKEVRSRLGVPESIEKVDDITSSTVKIVQEICQRLKEPKSDLIGRAVNEVGTKKALELLYAAETIEANGGLMINNGSRRRTPGGVFLHLLRNDKHVDKDTVDRIFEAEQESRKIAAKKRKRTAMEKKAAKVIRALEAQMFGEDARSQSSEDDESAEMDQVPIKKSVPDEKPASRTSDLEDGEIDD